MEIRFAGKQDLDRINELRKQANDIHAAGKPDVFKPGFSKDIQKILFKKWKDPDCRIVAAEQNGAICAYHFDALIHSKNLFCLPRQKRFFIVIPLCGQSAIFASAKPMHSLPRSGLAVLRALKYSRSVSPQRTRWLA